MMNAQGVTATIEALIPRITALPNAIGPNRVAIAADISTCFGPGADELRARGETIGFATMTDEDAFAVCLPILTNEEEKFRASLVRAHKEAGPRGIVLVYLSGNMYATVALPFIPNTPENLAAKWSRSSIFARETPRGVS